MGDGNGSAGRTMKGGPKAGMNGQHWVENVRGIIPPIKTFNIKVSSGLLNACFNTYMSYTSTVDY